MICPDCATAQTDHNWGGYHAHCQGCQVRALASGMAFFTSRAERRITPAYRACLHTLFGEDADAGHLQVKKEYDRIGALRNARKR
ncbi:MAG: hypothetical protein PHU77_00220 [Simplicispira sp.]|nr:hypothetical protein [Simplicispira sp.]